MKKEQTPEVTSIISTEAEKGGTTPAMRQIIIETDGDTINLAKAEVSGRIELVGILQNLISFLNQPKK